MPIVVLAHGVLGPLDEVVFVSIAIVFVGMMGLSWFRSQQLEDEDSDVMESDLITDDATSNPDHFELQ